MKTFKEYLFRWKFHRELFVLLLLFLFSVGFAQIDVDSLKNRHLCDTCVSLDLPKINAGMKDSLLKKVDLSAIDLDIVKGEVKDKIYSSIPDSNFVKSLKIKSRNKIDQVKAEALLKLKNADYKPKISGIITSESYGTNYLDPYSKSELFYSRLYGSPTVTFGALPFACNFYYTTEDNSFYNSNFFTVDFDIEEFMRNQREKLENKIQDQIKEQKSSLSKLRESLKSGDDLKRKLAEEKAELSDMEGKMLQLKEKAKSDAENKLNDLKLETTQKLVEVKETVKDSTTQLIEEKKDNLDNMKDSVIGTIQLAEYEKKYELYKDSVQQQKEKIEKLIATYEETKQRIQGLKDLNDQLTDSLQDAKKKYLSKEYASSKLSKHPHYQKVEKLMKKVQEFKVGMTYPVFSRYTLNGIPVRGISTSLNFDKNKLQITGGKTFKQELNTFGIDQPQPLFERNVMGIRSVQQLGSNHSISLANVTFFDDYQGNKGLQNILHTLEVENNFGQKLKTTVILNHSIYLENIELDKPVLEEPAPEIDPLFDLISNTSFLLKGEVTATKNIEFNGTIEQINPGYHTVGNPYLRSNFRELNVSTKLHFFKRQIIGSANYKDFRDNILAYTNATNEMSGYGLGVRSQFKNQKIPNFTFQHSPYQQGNNNPDTMFRTDNQLSVTSFMLMKQWKMKASMMSGIASYVNSQIDYNMGERLINNSMYLASLNLTNKKMNLSLSGSRNITGPIVDTLNFTGVRVGLNQINGDKVNFSLSSFQDFYDSGAKRSQIILQARLQVIKKMQISVNGEYGYIKGLFGVLEKDIIGGRVLLSYNF